MRKSKTTKKRNKNDDKKRLDIFIKQSHNSDLSDNSVIHLVKLLARKAAEEDYLRSIIKTDQGEETS